MLTEAEAKTKWCPFARGALVHVMSKSGDEQFEQLSIQPGTGYNRVQRTEKDRKETSTHFPMSCACIASDCAAWRGHLEWRSGNGPWHTGDDGGAADETRVVGFCGLAGTPQ